MDATGARAAGAGLPRRLRRNAGDILFILGALVLGYFLWPSSLGGCTTLTIVSGQSMEPTYYTGDLVVSRCADYAVGDVVVYNPPNVGSARVIHRIIDGDAESGWVIQGDNNDFVDPWTPTNERILGASTLHLPKVGLLGTVLVSPMTWISLLLVAAALVIWPGKPTPGVAPEELAQDDDEPTSDPEPEVLPEGDAVDVEQVAP